MMPSARKTEKKCEIDEGATERWTEREREREQQEARRGEGNADRERRRDGTIADAMGATRTEI